MPSAYLQPAEYAAYGVSDATAALVSNASSMIDAYLARPQGAQVNFDKNGNPAYMAAATAKGSWTLGSPLNAGQNIAVQLVGPAIGQDFVGEVLVLDRSSTTAMEAVLVTAVAGQVVTLANVQFAHAQTATAESGMTILEERPMPGNRSQTRLAQWPIQSIMSGLGRYGYGRRSDQVAGQYAEFNLIATISAFGGPPQWIPWDVSHASVDYSTGEIWIPAGVLLAYYSQVRIRYLAGWAQASIPADIKQACANIVRGLLDSPLGGNVKSMKAGDTAIQRFSATALDDDTRALLLNYRARVLV